jgi:hypothetical protein
MDEYMTALDNATIYKTMYSIKSGNHELYTKNGKIALNDDDNKRHILAVLLPILA